MNEKDTLSVQMIIPVSDDDWTGSHLIFCQWLPESKSDEIQIIDGNKTVTIRFDKSCVSSVCEVDDDLISKWGNISVAKAIVEVVVENVNVDLLKFIYDERESPKGIHHGISPGDRHYQDLQEAYVELGDNIASLAIENINKVLSYARNIKGQYWVSELKYEKNRLGNLNLLFNSIAKISAGEPFRWCPPSADIIEICISKDELEIKKEEWVHLVSHVQNNTRPNLVLELLANSRYLFSNGHMRSAIIEVVTALEVSVSRFSKKPNIEMLSIFEHLERGDIDNIGKQIEHMGFSGSMRYLIPFVFDEVAIPKEILSKCFKALDVRNNVVHQGQRSVSQDLVSEILNAVSTCCKFLDSYTLK